MSKIFILIVTLSISAANGYSQEMSISGNVQDTSAKIPLQHAVAMAIRLNDSVLVSHTRTNEKGFFKLSLPIDTVQVIISHPKFGDQSFYIFGSTTNHEFNFGKIILPPISHTLQEIVIYAYKDPVYYKGDTLVYTADSFKVKPNATVEDLLKKLPGIKVDAEGKITSQGKKVDQVLVDGDEFFGSDPTVATQNLNANTVESVQVYEKKNEQAADDGNETIQVMNLKLKEEAKKGYFGKLSAASDMQNFYEGEMLANKFNSKQKVSVFALGSNTPRSSLGWGDMYKYGLNNEMNMQGDEDGNMYWSERQNENAGIPRTLKAGIYYNNKISSKTKLSSNYSYNNNQLTSKSETVSQYFLTDTSYSTANNNRSDQINESHNINFDLTQKLDSLTDLQIIPRLKLNSSKTAKNDNTDFINNEGILVRRTDISNRNNSKGYDLNTTVTITRKFKKRERLLYISYNNVLTNNSSDGILVSNNTYFNSIIPNDSIDQKKINSNDNQLHNTTVKYTEPITKKINLEFTYNLNYNKNIQDKKTLNYANGEYSIKDSLFTNSFENKRMNNRIGLKFIYEVNKQRLSLGAKLRQISVKNTNLIINQQIGQTVNNILPFLTYRYKFSDNKRFYFEYVTSSNQPGIDQLQPVQDNTNPNRIKKGNPGLLPTFKHEFEASYNSYKAITGNYLWTRVGYTTTTNAFINAIEYDSIGRTITTPVNVNGNYDFNYGISGAYSLFSGLLSLEPDFNFNYNSYSNFINKQKNITTTANTSTGLNFNLRLDTLEFEIGYNFNYNSPGSTINAANNKPYTSQEIDANLLLRLPFKCLFETDVNYTINSQRSQGYNINYLIWNASLKKTFLKDENLIVSVDAMDILNQNINTSRTVQDNVITDNKTNIIARYILLKAVFKFNSNKVKEDEMDF